MTDQLVADIIAGGGVLQVGPPTDKERTQLDARIQAALRFDKLPPGKQLIVNGRSWRERELRLEDLPDWTRDPSASIHVPEQLRNPHPVVVELRDADRLLSVVGPARKRALRLLQALTVAALGCGHSVRLAENGVDSYGRYQRAEGQLLFQVRGHAVELSVCQENDRAKHVPTKQELADKQRYSWTTIPKYDYTPSPRLRLALKNDYGYRKSNWSDGVRTRLEDKLPEILHEIELRSDAAERARIAREEQERQDEVRKERRIARARAALIESNRADVLEEQLSDWMKARDLEVYLVAMTTVIEQIDDPMARAAAEEWRTWAQEHAERIDPLKHVLAMPPDPDPAYSDLAPFL